MPGPKHDLRKVKELVARGQVAYVSPSSSISYVTHILQCSLAEAVAVVREGILALENNDFCSQSSQWGDTLDVYGLGGFNGHNWYVKFSIDDNGDQDVLAQISFHPLESKMTLENGKGLEVTIDPSKRPKWRP